MSFWFVRLFSFVKNILFAYILAGSIVYLFHILYHRQRNMILPNGEISAVSGQKVTLAEFWDIWVTIPSSLTVSKKKALPTKSCQDQSSPEHLDLKSSDKFIKRIQNSGRNQINEQYWNPGIRKSPQSWKVPNDLQRNTV